MSIVGVLYDPVGGASASPVRSLSETAAIDAAPGGASWVVVIVESPYTRSSLGLTARVRFVFCLSVGNSLVGNEVGVVFDAAWFGAFPTLAFPFPSLDVPTERLLGCLRASEDAALGGWRLGASEDAALVVLVCGASKDAA